jgi:3-methyladenine DNA glycosylase AlkD
MDPVNHDKAPAPRIGRPLGLAAEIAALRARLAAAATPARAAGSKRYLKSDLAFLGASVPDVRRAARAFARAHPGLPTSDLRALAEALWRTDVNELRSVAIGILERFAASLGAADAGWLIALVDRADTWAHVDWLATKVIGPLVARDARVAARLDRWAKHRNFWVRRTALLAWHDPLLAGGGDFDHFARLAVPMLGEKEFFIKKAIGWVLRSAAKRGPARTYAFVAAHAAELQPLSFREATRNLPVVQRRRLERLRARAAAVSG